MVSTWIANGRIKIVKGKVDRDASDKYLDQTRPPKGKFVVPKVNYGVDVDDDPDAKEFATVADLKIRREKVQLAQAEMEYERAAAKLCEVSRVNKMIINNVKATIGVLQRMPDRVASRLAAKTGCSEREVRDILRQEIIDVCKDVANIGQSIPESLTGTEQ